MKHSVDLTENHAFSDTGKFNLDILITSEDSSRFPWGSNTRKVAQKLTERELVFTGDSHTIKTKRFCSTFSDGSRCDCCGEDLTRVPWKHLSGTLCNACATRMQVDLQELLPWKETVDKYIQRVENQRDRVIIESEYKGETEYG